MKTMEEAKKENMKVRTEAYMHGLELETLPANADEKFIRKNTQDIKNMILEFKVRDELTLKKEIHRGKAMHPFIKDILLQNVEGEAYFNWLVLTQAGEVQLCRQFSSVYDIWTRICSQAKTSEDILKYNEKVR